ncbi:NifB/NifX family molybdenum-iron cluster-binding protein [Geomonas propionica]|uniref:NifB/NifX family molybdenum-iron cluster-binding protein n=1 Tax=Geomonas propionica TaxID=2798582 RepID=A0ABS0YL86_9BACT|nr:NifB/NifX family molybdenum-iron cluster-binding protein [Geomonas propionica]MBJ6798735.1 NifB/NifX family molybdenum-iron cluster-binding protein [Geomonas propionica]
MKVCFPVEQNHGLSSAVYGHFGSAPGFVVVDSVTGECTAINNGDRVHQHGACNPVAGLGGHEVDAVVVGGIGGGALYKLNAAGLRVFRAGEGTIADNLALLSANQLQEYLPGHTCGGHGHSHGCSH